MAGQPDEHLGSSVLTEKQQKALANRRAFLEAEQAKEARREAWNDWREPTEAEF